MSDHIRPVSTAKFAAMLGVKENTVRSWCAEGTIPAEKIGVQWFIAASEYERLRLRLTSPAAVAQ